MVEVAVVGTAFLRGTTEFFLGGGGGMAGGMASPAPALHCERVGLQGEKRDTLGVVTDGHMIAVARVTLSFCCCSFIRRAPPALPALADHALHSPARMVRNTSKLSISTGLLYPTTTAQGGEAVLKPFQAEPSTQAAQKGYVVDLLASGLITVGGHRAPETAERRRERSPLIAARTAPPTAAAPPPVIPSLLETFPARGPLGPPFPTPPTPLPHPSPTPHSLLSISLVCIVTCGMGARRVRAPASCPTTAWFDSAVPALLAKYPSVTTDSSSD